MFAVNSFGETVAPLRAVTIGFSGSDFPAWNPLLPACPSFVLPDAGEKSVPKRRVCPGG
jgi:hypothetical protein